MECIACGSELVMEPDLHGARCQGCGMRYPLDALRGMHGSSCQIAQAAPPAAVEAELSGLQPVVVQGAGTLAASPAAPEELPSDEARPALDGWKTSIGLSILGCIFANIVCSLPYATYAGWIITIIYGLSTIIYVIAVYPSFFSAGPLLTSPGAISFFNCFFGGYVFGPLWNTNLTKRKKGISHLVDLAIMALGVGLVAFALISWDPHGTVDLEGVAPTEMLAESVENPLDRIDEAHGGSWSDDHTIWRSRDYICNGSIDSTTIDGAMDIARECLREMGLTEAESVSVMRSLASAEPVITQTHAASASVRAGRQTDIGRAEDHLHMCPIVPRGTEPVAVTQTRSSEFICDGRGFILSFYVRESFFVNKEDGSVKEGWMSRCGFEIAQASSSSA